ncbi:uncharacterized protein K02A2.6-like [Ruditapes philippinarum]|uniref:uncharacterized protein K02A2.6-like n=1 Tax=Ruditapes philippinarum TaxID=129788 RepID=UPI00295AA836|nr:uncharacterized protein K02A2.6-like [Ruditapes philippinarum]
MNNLPALPSFDLETDKSNAGTRWEKWIGRLENLFVGMKISNADQRRALLLHYAGEKVYDIYDVEKKDSAATYDATKKVLSDYFAPRKNVQIEIYNFRSYKQLEAQTIDEYVTELRTLAKNCAFADIDNEILQQVIQHGRSNQLRRRALREPDKKLDDIITMGRMFEQSDMQASAMENSENSRSVHKVSKFNSRTRGRAPMPHGRGNSRGSYANFGGRGKYGPKNQSNQRSRTRDGASANTCRKCGYEFPHRDKPCPATGKTCNVCKKPNHFARCCLAPKYQHVKEVSDNASSSLQFDSEEEYLYNITVKNVGKQKGSKTPKTQIKVNDKTITATIDTGSSVNILDETTYDYLGKPKIKTKGLPNLLPYGGGSALNVKGCVNLTVEKNRKYTVTPFYIVKGNHGALLGCETSCELEIIKYNQGITANMEDKYQGIYDGIGKLKGQKVKLHINRDVKPVAQRNRRTPFHLRKKVQKEIEKLLENDIIEEVKNESTPWVSPIVTPPKKNGDVRLCIDMREANKAIERERHPMPTIDELIHDMNGAKVFSKLDLKAGYNQLELDEESRSITTFSTHMGLYRYINV